MYYYILNRETLKVLTTIKGNYVDAVVTSPPYFHVKKYGNKIGELDNGSLDLYKIRLNMLFKSVRRVLKKNGVFCLNVGNGIRKDNGWSITTWDIYHMATKYFKLINTIIWVDNNRRYSTSDRLLVSRYEPVFLFAKSDSYRFNKDAIDPKYRVDVWNINGVSSGAVLEGVATFPLELALDLITLTSNVGDLILEPFLGSGTTMEACAILKRNCIGVEINEDYCSNVYGKIKNYMLDSDVLKVK